MRSSAAAISRPAPTTRTAWRPRSAGTRSSKVPRALPPRLCRTDISDPTYDRHVAHPERIPKSAPVTGGPPPKTPKKAFTAGAWEEARGLIWTHRKRMAFGLCLMLVNRLSGLVLPTTTKYLMDDVIRGGNW